MDWLKKLLEAQGLNESQIKAIVEGVDANYTGYVPPHRFDEVNTAKKKAEDDLKERDKQLEALQKNTGDVEALKKQIGDLQEANKTAKEKYDADMKELRTNTVLKLALAGEVHDADLVAGLIDKSKIELDDSGALKAGLDDQIKSLRESKAFLFVPKQEGKPKFKGAQPPDGKDKGGGGGEASIGADFAKAANDAGKPPAAANNPWG